MQNPQYPNPWKIVGIKRSVRIAITALCVGIIYSIADLRAISEFDVWQASERIVWILLIFYSFAFVFSLFGYAIPLRKDRRSRRAEWWGHTSVILLGGLSTLGALT